MTVLLSLEMWHISSSHRTRAEAAIIFLHIHKQMQLEGLTAGAARVAEIQKVGPTEVTRTWKCSAQRLLLLVPPSHLLSSGLHLLSCSCLS